MPLDASIILGGRPAQIDTPSNSLARVLGVQAAKQENQMRGMQMEAAQAAQQKQNRLAQLLAGQYGTAQDRESALLQGGFMEEAGKLQKGRMDAEKASADIGKTSAETEKAKIANTLSKIEMLGQIMAGVRDQSTYERALSVAQANGIDVSKSSPVYNPQEIEVNKQRALSVAQQLEQVWKQKGYDLNVNQAAETQRHNRMSEGTTMRGQDMTDQRTRDLNMNKVEENRLKAVEGQRTADMTRSSQVASFDTMLGTLDRLSQHPGLKRSVGVMGALPTMPGSDSANFQAELETFQSQAFIPMVAQLKGMGALSDAEGRKLTAAVGALNPKMGETAFRDSIKRITTDMQAARDRVSGAPSQPQQAAKTMSMADIQATAQRSGKTVEEVKAAAKAKGYSF